ncbi:8389_t:CDS:1, partial [Acaulospora morrowiae]
SFDEFQEVELTRTYALNRIINEALSDVAKEITLCQSNRPQKNQYHRDYK